VQIIIILKTKVNPLPDATLTANGPTTFCQGGSVNLSVPHAAGNSYAWTRNGTLVGSTHQITATQTGDYLITVTTPQGCTANSSIPVTVNPLPVINANGPLTFCAGNQITLTATGGIAPYTWSNNQTGENLTVNASGTFNVTDANGCSATANTTVTVNPLPDASITADGPTTFCQGGSVTLNGPIGAGLTYLWSNGATTPNINVNTSGDFTLTVTNANGCTATSAAIQVTVNVNPTVIINSTELLCQGGTPTLLTAHSETAVTYSWNGGIASNESTFWTHQANNTVTVTDVNGCQATETILLIVQPPPNAEIIGQTAICPNQQLTLAVAPSIGNFDYLWALNNETIGIDPEVIVPISGTLSLYINTNQGFGCQFILGPIEVSIENEHCPCLCTDGTPPQIVHAQSANELLVELNSTDNSIANRCIYTVNDVVINQNINLANIEWIVAPGKGIEITYGVSLIDQGSIFRGCDVMWKGIESSGQCRFINSTISDAQYAFTANTHPFFVGGANPITAFNSVTFTKCFIGLRNQSIFLPTIQQFHTINLNNTLFERGQLPLLPNYQGQVPQARPEGGLAGIRITHGFSLLVGETNRFENLFNGIIVNGARLTVTDAQFINIRNDENPHLYPCASASDLSQCDNGGLNTIFNQPSAAINAFNRSNVRVFSTFTEDENYNMFYNCKMGISSNFSHLNVEGCRFKHNGSQITDAAIRIHGSTHGFRYRLVNNRIYSNNNGIGITFSNNPFISKFKRNWVENNTVYLQQNTLPGINAYETRYGIASSFDQAVFSGTYFLLNDVIIETNDRSHGHYGMGNNFQSYYRNRGIRIADSEGLGIGASFCKNMFWSKNFSIGFSPAINNDAFKFEKVDNSTILQNCSFGTMRGFSFSDANNGIRIKENNMNSDSHGLFNPSIPNGSGSLYISESGIIGNQVDGKNRFISIVNFDINNIVAWNNSQVAGAINRFIVNTNTLSPYDLPEYYPAHTPAFDENLNQTCLFDPFFLCAPLTNPDQYNDPFSCNTILGDNPDRSPGEEVHVLRSIAAAYAANQMSFAWHSEASAHKIKRSIDENLKSSMLQLPDTGIYTALKYELSQSVESKFNRVDSLMQYNKTDSMLIAHFEFADSLYLHWDSLATYFEQNILADTSLWTESVLNQYAQTLDSLHFYWANWEAQQAILRGKLSTQANIGQVVNVAIPVQPGNIFEGYEREINVILLNLLSNEDYLLSESDVQTIDFVAAQCPLSHGLAVYKARGIQMGYKANVGYDNQAICKLVGLQYRKPNQQTDNQKLVLQVYPNPSNGRLSIALQGNTNRYKLHALRLVNVMGQEIYQLHCNSEEMELDLRALSISSGIYLLQTQLSSGEVLQSKIIYHEK
jgi:hypothetical protein